MMSNKVIKMRSAVRRFGILVLLLSLNGCGTEPPAPVPVERPVTPPQDSGAGKNIKSRIPPQTGKVPASK
jgi:predicted small lipoprotein YifL